MTFEFDGEKYQFGGDGNCGLRRNFQTSSKESNMNENIVTITRAPVLTLWAAVVAERLGYDQDVALTLGKAVAGLNAQAKGRSLGIFHPPKGADGETPRKAGLGEEFWVRVCGRAVPARSTAAGVRAVIKDQSIDPGKVQHYLENAFGDSLAAAREAMEELAAAFDPRSLEEVAYELYEQFRPKIASGQAGWGQKGPLDLNLIRSLAGKV
jgi:hypothetical protein